MICGSFWELKSSVNGYAFPVGEELKTQVSFGRLFEPIDDLTFPELKDGLIPRLKVRLLEDGYICWLDRKDIDDKVIFRDSWYPNMLSEKQIKGCLPKVINWIKNASTRKNQYLWGGTLGPNFDCSGLIQSAFASQGIWIPRDAYQQESFSQNVKVENNNFVNLTLGDLLFFGNSSKCNHVAIYDGENNFWHSSGLEYGHNGINGDLLKSKSQHSVATYYLSKLRTAGRIVSCHNGTTLA